MDHLWLIFAAWCGYFALHSALASLTAKRWAARRLGAWMPYYRLLYNGLAVALLIPPLWLTYAHRGPPLWAWTGWAGWLADGLALVAVGLFLWSLRFYDGGEFLGLRQVKQGQRAPEDQETLHISPLHRHVRHPWYALGLVLLWTRDLDPSQLTATIAASLYFVIGSRLEERKLLTYHGEAYARYRARAPGLIPRPWRRLSAAEARAIAQDAARPEANHDA